MKSNTFSENECVDSSENDVERSLIETIIYIIGKFVPGLVTLLSVRILTTLYDSDTYGHYTAILALGMILAGLFSGWLQMAVLREYPLWKQGLCRTPLIRNVWVGYLLSLGLGLLVTGVIACVPGNSFLPADPAVLGWAFVIATGTGWLTLSTNFLRSDRRPLAYSITNSLSSTGKLGFGVLATLWLGVNASSLLGGYLLAVLLAGAGAYGWFHHSQRKVQKKQWDTGSHPAIPLTGGLWSLFVFGFPLALAQFCSQLLNLSDRYMLSLLASDAEAGIYAVGYDLGDMTVRLVILSVNVSAYTAILECYERKGRQPAETLATSLSGLYLALALPLMAGCILFNREMVELCAAPAFSQAAVIIPIIALSDLLLGITQFQNIGLHVGKKTGRLALIMMFAAVVNILLNIVFIPTYGINAAALTTLFATLVLFLIFPLASKKWFTWRIPVLPLLWLLGGVMAMFMVQLFFIDIQSDGGAEVVVNYWPSLIKKLLATGVVYLPFLYFSKAVRFK